MAKKKFKYAVVYSDGGYQTEESIPGAGYGLHGYCFDTLEGVRMAKIPVLVTPAGYQPKATGAQLKDDSYNPEYTAMGLSVKLKEPIVKEHPDGLVFDAWFGLGNVTAQRAELEAFLAVFDNDQFEADHYNIFSDSMYLVKGFLKQVDGWITNKWKKADGNDVMHRDLWERIVAIRDSHTDRITLQHIKAHEGHFGNEMADRNATFGLVNSVFAAMTKTPAEVQWHWTALSDKNYWEPEKNIPELLRTKWMYRLTGQEVLKLEIGGKTFYSYFHGDHGESPDPELTGKKDPAAGFSLLFTPERVDVIEKAIAHHETNMWEHDNFMYKSDVMAMVNISTIGTPKMMWEINTAGFKSMWLRDHRNDVINIKKAIVSKMLRPPRLSFRLLDEEAIAKDVLLSLLHIKGVDFEGKKDFHPYSLTINDLTDKFYEKAVLKDGKDGATKLTNFYDQVAKAVTVNVENHVTKKPLKLILTRGIDLPTRNVMSNISGDNPKVYLVTWPFSKQVFQYATVILTDNEYSVWIGSYSNKRYVLPEEM